MTTLAQRRTEHRRLAILQIVAEGEGVAVGRDIVASMLAAIGEPAHTLDRDLRWLARAGAVATRETDGVTLVTLTELGEDAVARRARIDGVARPR